MIKLTHTSQPETQQIQRKFVRVKLKGPCINNIIDLKSDENQVTNGKRKYNKEKNGPKTPLPRSPTKQRYLLNTACF